MKRPGFVPFATLLAGFVVVLSGSLVAHANEAGGLPAVDARVTVLEGLVAAQQSALAALQTSVASLQNSVASLQNSVASLQNGLTALQTANGNLQNALNQESATRAAGDTALQAAISQEAQTRLAKDQQLQALIGASGPKVFSTRNEDTFLVNGSGIVGSVGPLPAGNYVVIAKAAVENLDHTAQWLCSLLLDNDAPVDSTDTHTQSQGVGENIAKSLSSFMNGAVITLAAPGSVRLSCFTSEASSLLNNVQMIAIQVGQRF